MDEISAEIWPDLRLPLWGVWGSQGGEHMFDPLAYSWPNSALTLDSSYRQFRLLSRVNNEGIRLCNLLLSLAFG